MNHENFIQWVRKQLLPNLPERSALVIDNASYHNVQINKDPTSTSTKEMMIKWLVERGIPHNPRSTKPQLYEIIKEKKSNFKQYVLDTELAKYGHIVLRLPPYHPELNPIEKVWATVKNYVASRNLTFRLNDAIKLAEEKFSEITKNEWENICDHVNNIATEYMIKEHLLDNATDEFQFVANTGDSDEEDDLEEISSDEDIENQLGISVLPQTDEEDV